MTMTPPEFAEWDLSVDVVIAGTGAAALSGALTAAMHGLFPLVVEKAGAWGGTTAWSGGGVWVPVNSMMAAAGMQDSPENAMSYLDATVGEVGPASSPERKRAYIDSARAMVDLFAQEGFQWDLGAHYPDYHFEFPSARIGRMLEGTPFDVNRLGPWADTMRQRETFAWVPIKTDEISRAVHTAHSVSGLLTSARLMARLASARLRGRRLASMGGSLVAQLMFLIQRRGVPVWLNSPLEDLIVEDDRVVGAMVKRGDRTMRVRAKHGVLLAVGGFSRNDEIRRRYHDFGASWSSTIAEDQGDGLEIGTKAGAATAFLDDAFWVPMLFPPGSPPVTALWERGQPGAIMVDSTGQRFVNEAASYKDVALTMLDRAKKSPGQRTWLIVDSTHRRKYPFGMAPPGYTPRRWLKDEFIIKTSTLDEIARRCNIDPAALRASVQRFNALVDQGKDTDFGRGDTVYDNYYGDPHNKPNPNLGPVAKAPFYAAEIHPGDIGSCGGLLTDENARVLREDGSVILGLYAAGNTTATVMGHRYPGPGSTIGPAATFGYVAMRHAAHST